jgi:hypothetical protein
MNMLYLELLHHFTTSTCFTLNTAETMRTVWRVQIPRLAFSYDFVMHGILALSALHLAQSQPSPRKEMYIAEGQSLHQTGLRIATTLLPHVTKDNCAPLWIFNAITSLVSLASPRQPGDILLVGPHGVAEWLQLLRGTQSMIMLNEANLRAGPLGPMFISGRNRSMLRAAHARDQTIESKHLSDLMSLISQPQVAISDSNLLSSTQSKLAPSHLAAYTTAIDELRPSFNIAYAPNFQTYESADVFIWLFRITDSFLDLLVEKRQEALVIFAHFCVVLKRFDSTWYMNGWYEHLLSQIWEMLDEVHRLWIRWPIEETGIVLF